jgi:serine/threonine protein kinase
MVCGMEANDPVQAPESQSKSKLFVGRYRITRTLGSGGSGKVFQAWDEQLHRFVAIKRWEPLEPLQEDPKGTVRLWHEATTLAAIQHPNILTIHDFGMDGDHPYVITEFVDGETLDTVIKRGPFTVEDFSDAAQQILEALIAAHEAGLIHRDLKPQNIMRTRRPGGAWQYKILDFGLARFVTHPKTQSLEGNTSIYGSILYIAPEQLRHQPLDARTDIYSLGCVFYTMLSGESAVEGDTIPALITSNLQHEFKPLVEWCPALPAPLCDWVMKALAQEPENRFATAAAALTALRRILSGTGPAHTIRVNPSPDLQVAPSIRVMPAPSQAAAKPPTPSRSTTWHWALPTAAAVFLVIVVAVGLIRHQHRSSFEAATLAPTVPVPPAAQIRWASESLPVEDVITLWPPNIANARRPLIQRYFEQMRDMDDPHWGSIGAVLETLAVVQFNARHNPRERRAVGNLTYHDHTGRTLGELDVVIWNMTENRAEVVYEAVVSDQLHRKGTSSRNQIRRFEQAVKEGKVAKILHPDDPSWQFVPAQFEQARIEIMGNQGALAAGFESEVDITRFETDFLQRKLLDWRKAHRRPPQKKK